MAKRKVVAAMAAKQTRKTGRKAAPDDAAIEQRIIDAAMHLAALQGWTDTRMSDIAQEAGIELAAVRHLFGSKMAILSVLFRRIDEAMLADIDPYIADEPVKDRLFDLIMRRLDAMEPYRDGIAAVLRDLRRDPPALACLLAGPVRNSLEWLLDAAHVRRWGPLAPLQTKGLGLVFVAVMRVWLEDDSEDKGRTMAALDKALGRAESVASFLHRGPRRRRRRARAEAAEGADDTAADAAAS
jgi:AcrR family transcriptional regulator